MPRKPRITRKTRPMLTEQMRHFLETGEFLKGSQNVVVFRLAGKHAGDAGELREVWDQHRDEIMRDWIRQNPGSRPWCWWRLDAVEPRRKIRGSGIPIEDDLEMGIPRRWMNVTQENPPLIESQASYLSRLGLLTASERQFLRYNQHFMEPVGLGEE